MNRAESKVILNAAVFAVSLILINEASARDIVSASNTAVSTVKSVAQVLAIMGVVGGGAIMQVPGLGETGKRVCVSGLIGCACAFGAPAFMSLMKNVFGS